MSFIVQFRRVFTAIIICASLTACAGPDVASGIYDPLETRNRQIHESNRQLDKTLVGPAADVYGNGVPEPVRIGVGHFASNLGIPGTVVNDILQFRLGDALHNSARFLMNTTVGIGGILDPASDAGLEARNSDFGETLHVWGFKEGAYRELPLLGPSTSRDTVGMAVDFFLDPVGLLIPAPERYISTLASGASKIGDRYRFSDTVDSILYDSADSYAQARLLYLENRRFQLGQDSAEIDAELYDLYEEYNE